MENNNYKKDFVLRMNLTLFLLLKTPIEKAVMFAIFSFSSNGNGRCWAGQRKIAERAGCSASSVVSLKKKWLKQGILEKVGKKKTLGGKSDVLRLSGQWLTTNNQSKKLRLSGQLTSIKRLPRNLKQLNETININTLGLTSKPKRKVSSKRKQKSFPQKDYSLLLEEYQKLKEMTLQGSEFNPVKQTLKTMFLDGRSVDQILAVMRWVGAQGYNDWTIRTVQLKLPEVLPKLGYSQTISKRPRTDLEKKLIEIHKNRGGDQK